MFLASVSFLRDIILPLRVPFDILSTKPGKGKKILSTRLTSIVRPSFRTHGGCASHACAMCLRLWFIYSAFSSRSPSRLRLRKKISPSGRTWFRVTFSTSTHVSGFFRFPTTFVSVTTETCLLSIIFDTQIWFEFFFIFRDFRFFGSALCPIRIQCDMKKSSRIFWYKMKLSGPGGIEEIANRFFAARICRRGKKKIKKKRCRCWEKAVAVWKRVFEGSE